MLRLALKMLFGDRAKYGMLVCGLSFCALLMSQQTSVFCGLLLWTTATVRNIRVPIWVADSKVEQANEVVSMREIEVQRVRSVPGVQWAVPLFWGIQQARLPDGTFQAIQLTGLDGASLVGRPAIMRSGRIEDLRLPNAVIVDQVAISKFAKRGIRLKIGTVFEINDKEARVVGICETQRSFLGQPYVFTTYSRALEYAPPQRKLLSFILVQPKPEQDPAALVRRISQCSGLRAFGYLFLGHLDVVRAQHWNSDLVWNGSSARARGRHRHRGANVLSFRARKHAVSRRPQSHGSNLPSARTDGFASGIYSRLYRVRNRRRHRGDFRKLGSAKGRATVLHALANPGVHRRGDLNYL